MLLCVIRFLCVAQVIRVLRLTQYHLFGMDPSKVETETTMEQSDEYHEPIGKSSKTLPKSNSQRCRDYRARLKGSYERYMKSELNEPESPPKKSVKNNSQRCREYRERLRAAKLSNRTTQLNDKLGNVSGSSSTQESPSSWLKTRKSNSQRCREYRARLKLRASMSSIGSSKQLRQLTDQTDNFSESSIAYNCSETVLNETSLADAETSGSVAGSGAYGDDSNEIYLRAKWKGLRDTFRCELKKNLICQSNKYPNEPTWKHYKELQFLKDQMHPKPPVWDLRDKPVDPLILSLTPSTSQNSSQTEMRRTGKEAETTETSGDNIENISFINVKEEIEDFNTIPDFIEKSERLARENGNFMSCDDSNPLSETQTFNETCSLNPTSNDTSKESLVDAIELSGQFDDNYHFLMSLLPHIQKISGERQMLLRMRIQELVYKEVYKKIA